MMAVCDKATSAWKIARRVDAVASRVLRAEVRGRRVHPPVNRRNRVAPCGAIASATTPRDGGARCGVVGLRAEDDGRVPRQGGSGRSRPSVGEAGACRCCVSSTEF